MAGVAALLSPTTAIVDYPAIARSFAADVTAAGGQVLTATPVTALRLRGDDAGRGRHPGRLLHAVPAGHLRRACRRTCSPRPPATRRAPEIIPFRGEYLRLRPHAAGRVRRLIYPVPDPRYPFLGVHLTPRVDGTADLGPTRCSRWPAKGTGAPT